MTRNQVTWLLGKEGNRISQQNADTNQQNAETNVVNAETNRQEANLHAEESDYNRTSNVVGGIVSFFTTVALIILLL